MQYRLKRCVEAAFLVAGALFAGCATALAQDAAPAPPPIDTGDTAWMLTSSVLVLAMLVPGLALFYAGMVRKKNALAILMQCTFAAGILSVIWIVIGYTLAFTEGNPFFGGLTKLMLAGIEPSTPAPAAATIPEFVRCSATFAIISGHRPWGHGRSHEVLRRIFLSLWVVFAYAPIAHGLGLGGLSAAGVLTAGGTSFTSTRRSPACRSHHRQRIA
jgi:Amt family ammonium transporter